MRGMILAAIFFGFALGAAAADCRYPGASWEHASTAEQAGWSPEKLKRTREYSATLDTDAVMLVGSGKILTEWGETGTRYNIHSIRKSFLSALYGIHSKDGTSDLGASMDSTSPGATRSIRLIRFG